MPRPDDTPITVDDDGWESHPSWVAIRANRVQTTGTTLTDSEIVHREYVQVTISRVKRKRDLNRDWWHEDGRIIEVAMSMAQWGGFVSSFGQGTGIPVTLSSYEGHEGWMVPGAPYEPRIATSLAEVRSATKRSMEGVDEAFAAVMDGWDRKAGRREMEGLLNTLRHKIGNAPSNMTFAAKSLTEHAENTVAKMRADVEGMVVAHAESLGLSAGDFPMLGELTAGDKS